MAWLTSLFKKPQAIDDSTLSADDVAKKPVVGPPLAVLSPDIGGANSFRVSFFADTTTAAAEIENLTPEIRCSTHAFWALHDEPVASPKGRSEALVLIRANQTSGVVYAVSFADMESAWSFARLEAKRGLDISKVLILWAAFATVSKEPDDVSFVPAQAPTTKAQSAVTLPSRSVGDLKTGETAREGARHEEPPISNGNAAPEREKSAEAEAERSREIARLAEEEEASRVARQAEAELRAARAAADAARGLAEAETARRLEEQAEADASAKAKDEARAAAEAKVRAKVFKILLVGDSIVI